jgi:hypothetical protein
MKNAKNLIKSWFESDRDFETGKALYMKIGANISFKTMLNRGGKSDENYKFLCYELAKLAGISEQQYKMMLKKPLEIAAPPKPVKLNINDLPVEKLADDFAELNLDDLNYKIARDLAKKLDLKLENLKKETVMDALVAFQHKKKVDAVPVSIKRSIKLRDQFPFLKRKDCPGVLKELVADMLTDYENYISNHAKLVDEDNPAMVAELSKSVVEDYLDNRAIWKELNHYKETGRLLGEHPIFEWIHRRDEIRQLPPAELVKLRDNLNNKIPRTKKLIADDPEHKDTAKRAERVAQFEQELAEVNTLLGLNG